MEDTTLEPTVDQSLVDKIVNILKSHGDFDQFRRECIADVDTKPAYQNLSQRVEGSVQSFLADLEWKPDLNKNQLRDSVRKHIQDSGYLEVGVERIVDQVVNPKISTNFLPKIEEVVYKMMGLPKPTATSETTCVTKYTPPPQPLATEKLFGNLLPTDLDPISPESDSFKEKEDCVLDESESNDNLSSRTPKDDDSPSFEQSNAVQTWAENTNESVLSDISGLTSNSSQSHYSFSNKCQYSSLKNAICSHDSATKDVELSSEIVNSNSTKGFIDDIKSPSICSVDTASKLSADDSEDIIKIDINVSEEKGEPCLSEKGNAFNISPLKENHTQVVAVKYYESANTEDIHDENVKESSNLGEKSVEITSNKMIKETPLEDETLIEKSVVDSVQPKFESHVNSVSEIEGLPGITDSKHKLLTPNSESTIKIFLEEESTAKSDKLTSDITQETIKFDGFDDTIGNPVTDQKSEKTIKNPLKERVVDDTKVIKQHDKDDRGKDVDKRRSKESSKNRKEKRVESSESKSDGKNDHRSKHEGKPSRDKNKHGSKYDQNKSRKHDSILCKNEGNGELKPAQDKSGNKDKHKSELHLNKDDKKVLKSDKAKKYDKYSKDSSNEFEKKKEHLSKDSSKGSKDKKISRDTSCRNDSRGKDDKHYHRNKSTSDYSKADKKLKEKHYSKSKNNFKSEKPEVKEHRHSEKSSSGGSSKPKLSEEAKPSNVRHDSSSRSSDRRKSRKDEARKHKSRIDHATGNLESNANSGGVSETTKMKDDGKKQKKKHESPSKDKNKEKKRETKNESVVDDHGVHRDRTSEDRRSTDRDSNGAASESSKRMANKSRTSQNQDTKKYSNEESNKTEDRGNSDSIEFIDQRESDDADVSSSDSMITPNFKKTHRKRVAARLSKPQKYRNFYEMKKLKLLRRRLRSQTLQYCANKKKLHKMFLERKVHQLKHYDCYSVSSDESPKFSKTESPKNLNTVSSNPEVINLVTSDDDSVICLSFDESKKPDKSVAQGSTSRENLIGNKIIVIGEDSPANKSDATVEEVQVVHEGYKYKPSESENFLLFVKSYIEESELDENTDVRMVQEIISRYVEKEYGQYGKINVKVADTRAEINSLNALEPGKSKNLANFPTTSVGQKKSDMQIDNMPETTEPPHPNVANQPRRSRSRKVVEKKTLYKRRGNTIRRAASAEKKFNKCRVIIRKREQEICNVNCDKQSEACTSETCGFKVKEKQLDTDTSVSKLTSTVQSQDITNLSPVPKELGDNSKESYFKFFENNNVDKSGSDDEKTSLSTDLIMPALQNLLMESGLLAPSNMASIAKQKPATSHLGRSRRVGLSKMPVKAFDKPKGISENGMIDSNGKPTGKGTFPVERPQESVTSSSGDIENKKSFSRGQRYDSDDLYKPRPLFNTGSRRNRAPSSQTVQDISPSWSDQEKTVTFKESNFATPSKRKRNR